jgi:hypothetical protein
VVNLHKACTKNAAYRLEQVQGGQEIEQCSTAVPGAVLLCQCYSCEWFSAGVYAATALHGARCTSVTHSCCCCCCCCPSCRTLRSAAAALLRTSCVIALLVNLKSKGPENFSGLHKGKRQQCSMEAVQQPQTCSHSSTVTTRHERCIRSVVQQQRAGSQS